MNEFDLMSLLPKENDEDCVRQNVNNSSLSKDDKLHLTDKINQMYYGTIHKKNVEILMPLVMEDFKGVCSASKIYLSTIKGEELTDVIEKIAVDSRQWESKTLVNFVFRKSPELSELGELYDKMSYFSPNWGAIIDKNMPYRYCLEVISYKL